MKKLKISSRINLHGPKSDDAAGYITDGIRFQKSAGFSAADLSLDFMKKTETGWENVIETAMTVSEAQQLPLEICHMPYSVTICKHPEEMPAFNAAFHRAIEAASIIKPKYAVMHPNTTTILLSDFDPVAQYDAVMSHLSPFVEHAQRAGVTLVLENMIPRGQNKPIYRYCSQPDEVCRIADALGVDVCWDFGHAHAAGLQQSEAIRYLGKRIKVLHVNDNRGNGDDDHLPPFLGKIDWKDAMKGLADIQFDGLFNYEVKSEKVPPELRSTLAQYLIEAAQTLISWI